MLSWSGSEHFGEVEVVQKGSWNCRKGVIFKERQGKGMHDGEKTLGGKLGMDMDQEGAICNGIPSGSEIGLYLLMPVKGIW